MTDHSAYQAVLPAAILPGGLIDRDEPAECSIGDLTMLDWDGTGTMLDGHDIESVSHDNTRRAGFALHALEAYASVTGGLFDEPAEQAARELLADLMHLADALGVRFDELAERARGRYTEEATGTK